MKVRDDTRVRSFQNRRAFSVVVSVTPSEVKMAEKLGVSVAEYASHLNIKNRPFRYRPWGHKHWTWRT